MRYSKMLLDCNNNLDIYGLYEELKYFFNNNRTENAELNLGYENLELLDFEVPEEGVEQISYVFLTKEEPPKAWLENMARKYPKLEFYLVYQNREKDIDGELIYKNGVLYNSIEENWKNDFAIQVEY